MVGTLHAHCYRALDCPTLAETKVKEWNEEHGEYPMGQSLKADVDDLTDSSPRTGEGDELLALANNYRANLTKPEHWPSEKVRSFYNCWCKWKEGNSLLDFTDLIETCISDVDQHPSAPTIMLGDEAQDWSKLEFKLFCDTWGKHVDTLMLTGDFDQALFTWRGADPYYFKNHQVEENNRRILSQSYRVPREVHDQALAWIRQIDEREDVDYLPRDADGCMRTAKHTWQHPESLIADVESNVSNNRTCMILTTCSYMLKPLIKCLRAAGIPYGNAYRKQNAAWNPLGRRKNAVMPVDRVAAFIAPLLGDEEWRHNGSMRRWTFAEFKAWIGALKSKERLAHGIKTLLDRPEFMIPETFGYFMQMFKTEEDAHEALSLNLEWFRDGLGNRFAKTIGYVIDVCEKYGHAAIVSQPHITIGTIHSVKGGEADVVYLFPDVSWQGMESWTGGGEGTNSVIRTFYVGMTRAREELVICQPSSNLSVEM